VIFPIPLKLIILIIVNIKIAESKINKKFVHLVNTKHCVKLGSNIWANVFNFVSKLQ